MYIPWLFHFLSKYYLINKRRTEICFKVVYSQNRTEASFHSAHQGTFISVTNFLILSVGGKNVYQRSCLCVCYSSRMNLLFARPTQPWRPCGTIHGSCSRSSAQATRILLIYLVLRIISKCCSAFWEEAWLFLTSSRAGPAPQQVWSSARPLYLKWEALTYSAAG